MYKNHIKDCPFNNRPVVLKREIKVTPKIQAWMLDDGETLKEAKYIAEDEALRQS